jgi:exosortase
LADVQASSGGLALGREPLRLAPAWDWNRVLSPKRVLLILLVVAGVVWIYWKPLTLWEAQWRAQSGAWGHGYLIPIIAVLIAHYRLLERPPRRLERCAWGFLLIAGGLAMRVVAHTLRYGYPTYLSFVPVVAGVMLWLLGWDMFRTVWVSSAYLVLMIPWQQKYYENVALPLQRLSAAATEVMLRAVGLAVERHDNVLMLESGPLQVAGACSGLHLLFAFVALGVMMAFICRRPLWERALIMVSSVPIAVFCNFVRVTLMAIASENLYFARRAMLAGESTWATAFFGSPESVESLRQTILDPVTFLHQSFGYVMLGLAFLLLWAELKLLHLLFVSDEESGTEGRLGPARPKGGASRAARAGG